MSSSPVTAFKILEATLQSIKDLSKKSYEFILDDESSALNAIGIAVDRYLHAALKVTRGGDTKDVSDLHLPHSAQIIETVDTFGEDIQPGKLVDWEKAKSNNLKQPQIHQVHIFNTLDLIFLNFNKLGKSFAESELATKVKQLKSETKAMLEYFSTTFTDIKDIVLRIAGRWDINI